MTTIFVLLASATLLVVIKRVRDIRSHYVCLTPKDMKAYKLGDLSHDDRRQVTMHLGLCEKCQQAMIDLDPDKTLDHLVED